MISDPDFDNILEGTIQLPPSPSPAIAPSPSIKKGGSGSTGTGPSSPPSSSPSTPTSFAPPSPPSSPSSVSSEESESKSKQDKIKEKTLVKVNKTPDVQADITSNTEPVSTIHLDPDSTKTEKPGLNILDNPQTVVRLVAVVTLFPVVSIFIAILSLVDESIRNLFSIFRY